ncbi:MAG: hypothetical protein RPT25_06865 [Cycloclasticus sp.]|jgi:hypothetical protein
MATTAQLDAINAAIASGVTEVAYDGVVSKYRNLAEMRDIRDELKAELGSASVERQHYAPVFDKGYR